MLEDRFANALTTQSTVAADGYIEALDHLLSMNNAAADCIDRTLAADPDFALAHCVRARVLLLGGNTKSAIQAAEHAVELATKGTRREQAHANIVAVATRGDSKAAWPMVLEHAKAYPRDALPLSFALGVYGLLGFGSLVDHHERQRDLLESVAHAWHEDWWFDSWLGWSYVETGQSAQGIPLLDRALDARPGNATAAHGRAHGYYETGAVEEGIAFIEAWLPTYGQEQPLHCHLAWHLGLFALQQGNWDKARETYLAFIRPAVSQALPMFTMIDSASFAWRGQIYGMRSDPALLAEIGSFAKRHFPNAGIAFVNYHRALVGGLAGLAFEVGGPGDDLAQRTSTQLSEAVGAFAGGDFQEAARGLAEIREVIPALGGSHAQRDLIIDTHIAALLGSGDTDGARAIAAARSQRRAGHLDNAWFALLKTAMTPH